MCKEHVAVLRKNIWSSQVYLSLGIIQNYYKIRKKIEKKSSDFFEKKNLMCNSYARIPKKLKLKFSKKSYFLPTHNDKTADF